MATRYLRDYVHPGYKMESPGWGLAGCSGCSGNGHGLGKYVQTSLVPPYVQARQRGRKIITPMQTSQAQLKGLKDDFMTTLQATTWIGYGIPNWAVLAVGGVLVFTLMKR